MNQTAKLTDYEINGCLPINAQELEQSLLSADDTGTDNSKGNYRGFRSGSEWNGNAAGRPKGALSKVQAMFYQDLLVDWQAHGIGAIESMRLDSPTKYCQLVASILPKALEIESDGTKWVINAAPSLSTQAWLSMHGLDKQPIDAQVIESTQDNDSTDTQA